MKIQTILLALTFAFVIYSCSNIEGKNQNQQDKLSNTELDSIRQNEPVRLKSKSNEAKAFCKEHHLNTDFCYFVDLSLHSGLKRFFIWDFQQDSIENSFLVSHGCYTYPWGKDASKQKAIVSNVDGSHASSVGKYIIGNRGQSEWGIGVNYLLHGQDNTNSNALKRQIVLHSWDEVPDNEIYPKGTPEGWGCPAMSNNGMKTVDEMLKASDENVLLWVIQ